jgi:hypothetical protein
LNWGSKPGKEVAVRKMWTGILLLLPLISSCSHTVTVKHEVEPIFITVQVNIQVQEQLNDFFDFEEELDG